MAGKNSPVALNVTVQLPEQAYKYLEANANGDPGAKLSAWTSYFVSQMAQGAVLIESADHQHMANLRGGKKFRSSREVAKEVEKALNRDEGQYAFSIQIDPAFIRPLEDLAAEQGVSVKELIQRGCDDIWSNGWLYNLQPEDGAMVPFDQEMVDMVRAATGKQRITSAEVKEVLASISVKQTAEVAA